MLGHGGHHCGHGIGHEVRGGATSGGTSYTRFVDKEVQIPRLCESAQGRRAIIRHECAGRDMQGHGRGHGGAAAGLAMRICMRAVLYRTNVLRRILPHADGDRTV